MGVSAMSHRSAKLEWTNTIWVDMIMSVCDDLNTMAFQSHESFFSIKKRLDAEDHATKNKTT